MRNRLSTSIFPSFLYKIEKIDFEQHWKNLRFQNHLVYQEITKSEFTPFGFKRFIEYYEVVYTHILLKLIPSICKTIVPPTASSIFLWRSIIMSADNLIA